MNSTIEGFTSSPCATKAGICMFAYHDYHSSHLYVPENPEKDFYCCDLIGRTCQSEKPECTVSQWHDHFGANPPFESKYIDYEMERPTFCAYNGRQCRHALLLPQKGQAGASGGPIAIRNDTSEAHYFCGLLSTSDNPVMVWGETPQCTAADWLV